MRVNWFSLSGRPFHYLLCLYTRSLGIVTFKGCFGFFAGAVAPARRGMREKARVSP